MRRNETFVTKIKERFLRYPCDVEVFHVPGQRSYREDTDGLYYENFYPLANCTTPPVVGLSQAQEMVGGDVIRRTCEALTSSALSSLLRISLRTPSVESDQWCTSRMFDTLLIPLLQYLPSNTTLSLSSGRNQSAPWDVAVRYMTFNSTQLTTGGLSEIGDIFYLGEYHPLDMISHAQVRKDGTHTSFSLLGILFTYLCPHSTIYSNVLSILCILFCLVDKWLTRQKRDLSRVNPILVTDHRQTVAYPKPKLTSFLIIKTVIGLFDDAAQYVFAWVSLFCRHGEAFHQEFADPLFRGLRRARRRLRRLSRAALLYLTMVIIIWGALSGTIFEGELHSYLITKPLIYLDTAADFLKHRPDYNLSFGSVALSLNASFRLGLINVDFDAALTEIALLYDTFRTSIIDRILERSILTNWVINTGVVGCEGIKLSDPLYDSRDYHCMLQKSPASWRSVYLHRDFMDHPLRRWVTRLIRGIQEGYLTRRSIWLDNELYHAASMRGKQFEPRGATIPDVTLDGMANLFIAIAIAYGLVFIQLGVGLAVEFADRH